MGKRWLWLRYKGEGFRRVRRRKLEGLEEEEMKDEGGRRIVPERSVWKIELLGGKG